MKGPLFGDSDDEDTKMDSLSPPRTIHKKAFGTRLFASDKDEQANQAGTGNGRYLKTRSSGDESLVSDLSTDDGSVLRTLDLNVSASPSQRRKRPSDHRPAGREEAYEDSDDGMFVSPRISPSYRTLDGRTVTSKNPFSPYTPATMTDDTNSDTVPMQTAPSFPVSFDAKITSSKETSDDTGTHLPTQTLPRPSKMNLLRRDNQVGQPWESNTTATVVGDGYPDRHGRYSFTGSPIEEIDILETDSATGMGSKVRRLTLNDRPNKKGEPERYRQQLFVNTKQDNTSVIPKDEISPTDVMSFPTPPTPTKAPRRYTPVRAAPPATPMMERRIGAMARSAFRGDDDDVSMSDSRTSCPPKSRFNEDFDIIGQLGNGSFGTVYKCLSRLDGCMYAVKAAKRQAKGESDRDRMLKEVYALAALSDQADTAAFHIVRYHQAWMEENRLYIQTELCTSTLQAAITRGMPDESRRYKLLREILLALEFIHRNGMVHLDIKPENIFIKNDQFKLGDFGLVSKISNSDVEEGDSRYMSMELLSGNRDDLTKSDIFSLGATMYEICLGRPLPTDGQEWQNIRAAVFSPLQNTSYELELIIKQMMHPDPNQRPRASELLKRRPLLSWEQKQLIEQKSKVLEANMALALQTQMMKKAPGPGRLMRANTWNGTLS